MSKVINIISNIITYLTIGIVLAVCVLVVPNLFGLKGYIVRSGSMEPVINTGSIAFVNIKEKNANVNDIVTYRLLDQQGNETLVTHRIIEETEDNMFITKGDANDSADLSPITKEQIVGIYKYQIPKVGYLISKLNKKVIVVIIMWIILLNAGSIVLSSVFSEKDTKSEVKEKVEK